jgi:uncharacterized beta-barrel protein YwiB (DUF1934 family)
MKCKVIISSQGDDWSSKISSEGDFEKDSSDRINIFYHIDGDSCLLTIDGEKITQTRHGKQELKLLFEKGKKSKCQLGDGEFCGYFDVFTKDIVVSVGKGGVKINLSYQNGEDNIVMKFIAMFL